MSETKAYKTKLYVLSETNYYKILGVSQDADLETISKAYKITAKQIHPDLNIDLSPQERSQAAKIFQTITSAFNVLKDSSERRRYDEELDFQRRKKESESKQVKFEPKVETQENTTEKKNEPIAFSFKQVRFVDIDKLKDEKIKKEQEQAIERFEKAKNLINQKRHDEAIEILRALTENYSSVAKYHSYLGLALDGKGWGGYSQAEFKVALHFDPNDEIAKKYYKPAETPSRHIKSSGSSVYANNEEDKAAKDSVLTRVRGFFGKK